MGIRLESPLQILETDKRRQELKESEPTYGAILTFPC